jgi:ribosomal protein L11 methyltransferase
MATYYAVQIELAEDAAELVQAVLDGTEPLGLEVRDHTLKAPAGAPPLPEGKVQLLAYYDAEAGAREALEEIRREFPDAVAAFAAVPEEDWAESWKRFVKPVRVGRVWVGPPWERKNAGDARVQVEIEPGMAFGTGDHPTTAMCLFELDHTLERRPGARVLDVGTGSGVLAIVARLLGAKQVVGNDIDPHAVRIARENAEHNRAEGIEFTDKPVERIGGQFEIVVANLFAGVLEQLAPRLADKLTADGELMITGILAPQAQGVLEAFEREGLKQTRRTALGEWVHFVLARR